jgi:hypothetical protein
MNSAAFDFFKIDFKPRRINLSSTFPVRAKCPKCKDDCYYYWYHVPSYFDDPSSSFSIFNWFKKYINKMNSDWYLDTEPRQNHNLSHFNFVWSEKSFKPRLLHTRGISNNTRMEFITCQCGDYVWAYTQQSIKNRPEIINRKARTSYPKKYPY